jgi:hypothetical protein
MKPLAQRFALCALLLGLAPAGQATACTDPPRVIGIQPALAPTTLDAQPGAVAYEVTYEHCGQTRRVLFGHLRPGDNDAPAASRTRPLIF